MRGGPGILRRAPIPRTGQVAIALAAGLVGFLLAAQLQSRQDLERRLATEREADLAQLLGDLSARSDRLQEEIIELRVRLATAATSSEREEVLLENARAELESVRILLGLIPVKGEGVEVAIADPEGAVGPDALLDAIQELRDAGAEALEVNGVRIVASTAFAGEAGAIRVGGMALQSPFRILAIGARDTLAEAMRIPGGVVDTIQARPGATVAVAPRRSLLISSLHPLPSFTYATPS